MANKKSAKAVTAADRITNASKIADGVVVDMAALLADNPTEFTALETALKTEVARLRKNQAVIKVLSGKNINEKTYGEVAADPEVVASGLQIVKGTKPQYDAKKNVIVDVVKYDSPAAIAMRDPKLVAAVDPDAVIEADIHMAKYDNRLDASTAVSTQLSQLTKGMRKAKRELHVKTQEEILLAKGKTIRSVAELAQLMGFSPAV
jgi:hypothetical protein